MPLRTTLLSIGTFTALAATSMVSGHRAPVAASISEPLVENASLLQPAAKVDDAVAAAVIESIARQFDTSDVVVQLGHVQIRPASIQDREVTGDGRLQIDGAGNWIAFHFNAMYDSASAEVTYPQLDLRGGSAEPVGHGSAIAASLDGQVTKAMENEFQSQPVCWTMRDARSTDLGRFTRVQGNGVADFGSEGSSPAQVEGLYDTASKPWVRVHYELGPAPGDTALASL